VPSGWRDWARAGFGLGGVYVARCMHRGQYREEGRARFIWDRRRRQWRRRSDQWDEIQLVTALDRRHVTAHRRQRYPPRFGHLWNLCNLWSSSCLNFWVKPLDEACSGAKSHFHISRIRAARSARGSHCGGVAQAAISAGHARRSNRSRMASGMNRLRGENM
jgi:hypothetical protein